MIIVRDALKNISYWFKPHEMDEILPLSKSSSMVSGIAPLVVYIRSILSSGDILIIEEPESHLHPGMQEKITDCIALLVKSGIKVIMTTHSEWVADRLSYLARLAHLEEHGKNFESYECAISEKDVGVWEFKRAAGNVGSTVGRADLIDGSYDLEYSTLAVEAFNRYDSIETKIDEVKNAQL